MDKKRFITDLIGLAEVFNKEMSSLFQETYYEALKHLEYDTFKLSLKRIIENERFFPQISVILEYAGGNIKDRIILAKDKLKEALKKVSAYDSIAFDDFVLHAIVKSLGGWDKLPLIDLKEVDNYFKFEFDSIYRAYSNLTTLNIEPILLGINDIKNGIKEPENFKKIGNVEVIEKWHLVYKKKEDQRKLINM